ncbi:hypothetical protein KY342_00285 [Candidatus Woesearchaeota archaeon]|nr:hypothetical protein [Candidatus Woesearchaeota archaeon]
MDDYEPLQRFIEYSRKGAYIGIVAGVAAGIFGGEQLTNSYSTLARVSLDTLLAIGAGFVGGVTGFVAGTLTSDLVNKIIRTKEERKNNQSTPKP